MTNKDIVEKISSILTPHLETKGLRLWDIELVKEGQNQILRIYIDTKEKETSINVEHCEATSRFLSQQLDTLDPISTPYMLEVSSPGINRTLKKESDYLEYLEEIIDIKLFKPLNKTKEFQGILKAYENELLTLECEKETFRFNIKEIASCKVAVFF